MTQPTPGALHHDLFNRCGLVVVAAGSGTRFGRLKQLVPLGGEPLLARTLSAFRALPFRDCRVVLPAGLIDDGTWAELQRQNAALARFTPVKGGGERAASVLLGTKALDKECEFVAVHDGARPFPPIDGTTKCLRMVQENSHLATVLVASRVTDTLKHMQNEDSPLVERTADRALFRRAETPQVSRRALLLEVLEAPEALTARDDAEALERAGHQTACVDYEGINLKVTHAEDLALAEALLQRRLQEDKEP